MSIDGKHFYSVTECEFTRTQTPHKLYTCLAADAALRHFDDALPTLSDEETGRLVEAAEVAAATLIALVGVPNTWLDLLQRLATDDLPTVREELLDTLYRHMLPSHERIVGARIDDATQRIRACVRPGREAALQNALMDLELGYGVAINEDISAAFALGWKAAKDPEWLIFEEPTKGSGDTSR